MSETRTLAGDLVVRGLTVRYPGGKTAVQEVDLTVRSGTTLGLVGESGSGKSTLGRALVGLVTPSAGTVTLGTADLLDPRMRRHRPTVQMVFQDPRSSLDPRMTVARTLRESIVLADGRDGWEDRAAELLDAVALPRTVLTALPRDLSGGQRQRVGLARALARRPSVIVADEITSALDVSVQAAVLKVLVDLQARFGTSLLVVSHNLAAVRYLSDEVAVMKDGRIVEHGPAQDVLGSPGHPYTRQLRAAVLEVDPAARKHPVTPSG